MKPQRFCSQFMVILSTLTLLGCAEQKTETVNSGIVSPPQAELPIGARLVDFQFVDQDGKTQTLVSVRGQFTILAFTACKTEYNPAISHLADLVDQKSNWRVKVVGIDVFWSSREICVPGQMCAALPSMGNPRFFAVCDSGKVVRDKYGVIESGRYFIIGPNGKIRAKGCIKDIDDLRSTLTHLIDEYMTEQELYLRE